MAMCKAATIAISILLLAAMPAMAHVTLLSPNGGEALKGGQAFDIEWEQTVYHPSSGFDIWYSESGPAGPWQVIARNYPVTDTNHYALYRYAWTVPFTESSDLRLRIRQNTDMGHQWEDTSSADVSISGSCCSGSAGNVNGDPAETIDIADLVHLVTWMFRGGDPPYCATEADLNGSGSLPADISDLIFMVNYMFQQGPPPAPCQ